MPIYTCPQAGLASKPQLVTAEWQRVIDLQQSGEVVPVKIKAVNKAGAYVNIGKITGFIPYKLMDRKRLLPFQKKLDDGTWAPPSAERYQALQGQTVNVKVVQVSVGSPCSCFPNAFGFNLLPVAGGLWVFWSSKFHITTCSWQVVVPERRLICSEKAFLLESLAVSLQPGDIIDGRVSSLHDFGAFVEVTSGNYPGVEVVLPLGEITWDWIPAARIRLVKGQVVRCKVLKVSAILFLAVCGCAPALFAWAAKAMHTRTHTQKNHFVLTLSPHADDWSSPAQRCGVHETDGGGPPEGDARCCDAHW